MSVNEVLLAVFSVLSSILIVVFVVAIGWYLVWKFFLSRFKLVRELLGQINDDTADTAKSSKSRKLRKD